MTPDPVAASVPLTAAHDLAPFSCGEPALDDWLKWQALGNPQSSATLRGTPRRPFRGLPSAVDLRRWTGFVAS